jgi:hypothetical protein
MPTRPSVFLTVTRIGFVHVLVLVPVLVLVLVPVLVPVLVTPPNFKRHPLPYMPLDRHQLLSLAPKAVLRVQKYLLLIRRHHPRHQ